MSKDRPQDQGSSHGARRTFTKEFKREAVRLVRQRRDEGVTLAQAARELAVRPALVWEWARRLDGKGTGRVEALPAPPSGESLDEEVRRLRRENAILKQEREFAKKAAAFFARESL